jgi:hypothetical protein
MLLSRMAWMIPMKQRQESTILFLCTGNYYRSRNAAILFSSVARGNHGRRNRAIWSVPGLFHEDKHLPGLGEQGWLLCWGRALRQPGVQTHRP